MKNSLVWAMILLLCFSSLALAEELVNEPVIDLNLAPDICEKLKSIPTQTEAYAAVPIEGTCLNTYCQLDLVRGLWYLTYDCFNQETNRCYQVTYSVRSTQGSLEVKLIWIPTDLGTLDDYFSSTVQEHLFEEKVQLWEQKWGRCDLWSPELKAEFFDKFQRTRSEGHVQWGLPGEDDMDYATAVCKAQQALDEIGISVEEWGLCEDATYVIDSEWEYWVFYYWAQVKIEDELNWVSVCTVMQGSDGEFYVNLGEAELLPELITYMEIVHKQ